MWHPPATHCAPRPDRELVGAEEAVAGGGSVRVAQPAGLTVSGAGQPATVRADDVAHAGGLLGPADLGLVPGLHAAPVAPCDRPLVAGARVAVREPRLVLRGRPC